MYNRVSHRNASPRSRPVSQRTIVDAKFEARNAGDACPLGDPKTDHPDRLGQAVTKPLTPIENRRFNDARPRSSVQSISSFEPRISQPRSSHQPSQVHYERLYYEQINHAKSVENELKNYQDVLSKLKAENSSAKIDYEELIASLQTEIQRLKGIETRVIQTESQKRRLEDDLRKLTTENKFLRQEHEESTNKLLEELKSKIRCYSLEKMEYLAQVERHQEEIQELRDQLEAMALDHATEKSHLMQLIEDQKLQIGEMSLGYEQMITQLNTNAIAAVREKDKTIEELKKNIEELKLQLGVFQKKQDLEQKLQSQAQNEISFSLKEATSHRDEIGKQIQRDSYKPIETHAKIIDSHYQAEWGQLPDVAPISQANIPTSEYFLKPVKYEGSQIYHTNTHTPIFHQNTNHTDNVSPSTCSNHNSSAFTASSRTVNAMPTVFASRRIIRLGDAENPFTSNANDQGRYSHWTVLSPHSNNQTSYSYSPVTPSTVADIKPDVSNLLVPNTVSFNQSLNLPEVEKLFVKKQGDEAKMTSYRVINYDAVSFYPPKQTGTTNLISDAMRTSDDNQSFESSIGMNRDDSALTIDSKIREVVNELHF